jgi:lipopolysaccharide transport system permease protein
MAGLVDGFRWALLGTGSPWATLLVSVLSATAILAGGASYFRRMERSFADLV